MGVNPKRGGKASKWMVKIMENPIKMDDLGYPYVWKHPYELSMSVFLGCYGDIPIFVRRWFAKR